VRRALLLAATALVAGGCGGTTASLGDAAQFVPANADVFVSVRTDGDDWRGFVRELLGQKVPAIPAGAREVAFTVVDGKARLVSTTTPAHPLADAAAYKSALAAIPSGATAIAYTSGARAARRLLSFPGQVLVTSNPARFRTRAGGHGPPALAVLAYRWGVAWLTKDGGGARAKSAGLPVTTSHYARGVEQLVTPYTPLLFDEIPADALAAIDFPLATGSFELLPALPKLLTSIFHGTRYDLPLELDGLLQGETAVYLRRGGEITVVTSPQDTRNAEHQLDELLSARNPPFDALPVYHATIGGQFVVSTSPKGIATFRGGGDKLSSKLELPEKVGAAVYIAPGAEGALAALGIRGTRPLTAWTLADGADPTLTIRLGEGSG
jgi:hypothetical protein